MTVSIRSGVSDGAIQYDGADKIVLNTTGATLSGNVAAVTQSAGNSSTLVATTAFANPGFVSSKNGYQKLPSGVMMQWGEYGTVSVVGNENKQYTFTFPIGFSTECYNCQLILRRDALFIGANDCATQLFSANTTHFSGVITAPNNGGNGGTYYIQMSAIGK